MRDSKTVGDSFLTEHKAIAIAKSRFPPQWLWREQRPDFHLDYIVEIVEEGEPTGKHFALQVKGNKGRKGKPLKLKYQLKAKHLRYHMRHHTCPVFLILVDVANEKAYWADTQKFGTGVSPQQLAGNGRISIPFEEENSLDNLQRFLSGFNCARRALAELNPGSIKAALLAEKTRLEKLDPRFRVSIDIHNEQPQVSFATQESLDFGLNIKGPDTAEFRQALRDFEERGSELVVDSSQVSAPGLPSMEDFLRSTPGQVKLECARNTEATLQLFSSPESMFLFQLEGVVKLGTKYATFRTHSPKHPLIVETSFTEESIARQEQHSLKFRFELSRWTEHPICDLPYFDSVRELIMRLDGDLSIELKFLVNGNRAFGAMMQGSNSTKSIANLMQLITKARTIARYFNVNPVLPRFKSISGKDIDNIHTVFELIEGRTVRIPAPDVAIGFTPVGTVPVTPAPETRAMTVRGEVYDFEFFGLKVGFSDLDHTFTHMKVESCTLDSAGKQEVTLKGNENSEWRMHREPTQSRKRSGNGKAA